MPYNTLVQRADVAALIPEEVSRAMLTTLADSSAALSLGTRIPVAATQVKFPVLSALPPAYWVAGDTGLKQTTTAAWAQKFLNIEELASIVPVPENVLEDTDFDIFAAIRPLMEQAIGRALDQAVFFGVNKPASQPTDIVAAAVAAANMTTRGTSTQAQGGLAGDISNLLATLENDGYLPTGGIGKTTLRGMVRMNRDTGGAQLGELAPDSWYGTPIQYPMRGLWPTGATPPGLYAEAIVGDFDNLVVGVRRDMTWKLIDQGVLTDQAGVIQFNLPQQDMVAMRVTFRAGWQIANPINYDQPVEASRYPFAVLRSPAS
jgi:Phage capsid family